MKRQKFGVWRRNSCSKFWVQISSNNSVEGLGFFKWVILGLFIVYFRSFSNKHLFLQQINVKNLHLVYGGLPNQLRYSNPLKVLQTCYLDILPFFLAFCTLLWLAFSVFFQKPFLRTLKMRWEMNENWQQTLVRRKNNAWAVWPNLAKLRYFGEHFKIFGNFWSVSLAKFWIFRTVLMVLGKCSLL